MDVIFVIASTSCWVFFYAIINAVLVCYTYFIVRDVSVSLSTVLSRKYCYSE